MSVEPILQHDVSVPSRPADVLASEADLFMLRESIAEALSAECDRRCLHAFFDGKNRLDETLWRQAADLGWLAVGVPEDDGGLGLGQQGLDILHRELGRCLAPGPFISTLAAAQWLLDVGDSTARITYLPQILAGELTVAIPATPGQGRPMSLVDGKVSGQSPLLLGSASAGLAIIPVVDGDGVAAWALIETGTAQAQLADRPIWDRTRRMCVLSCDAAPAAAVIDDPQDRGLWSLHRQISLAVASDSIGGADGISQQTIEYMKTRHQFGRPIGSFQALKHRAADLVIIRTTEENLVEQGVESAHLGLPDADMWVALAKASATKAYAFVASDCVLLHGGVGHTWEYDCHMFLKRARLNETLGMSNQDQCDFAAGALAAASRAHRTTAELAR